MLLLPQHFSCKKIDLKREVLVITGQAQDVDYRSAFLFGDIADAGEDNSFAEYGFVLSMSGTPTTNDQKIVAGTNWISGAYNSPVAGLEGNTTYFFRSYVRTNDGDVYGNVNTFKTSVSPAADPPGVTTLPMLNVFETSAIAQGNVTSTGGADVTRRGFCISLDPMPNIQDNAFSENGSGLGEFQETFINLTEGTQYYVRAYAENEIGIAYGVQVIFTTGEGGEPVSEWLSYDDGENWDGIGLTNDGSFDVVIRFTPQDLAPYAGMAITKFRIFVREDLPVEYLVEIFEGESPTIDDLAYDQQVEEPSTSDWTEVTLDEPYIIDGTQEIWAGYYVSGSLAGYFPAGIDDGPAVAGFGDLIGTGNPIQWGLLSNGGIDSNWNIQIFVTNQFDEEIQMTRQQPVNIERSGKFTEPVQFQSSKQSDQ